MPRDNYISIKASQDEKLKLKLEATKLGVSLSDYIRMRVLGNITPSLAPSHIDFNFNPREEIAK